MTRVTLFHLPDGRLAGYECKGHAGYAEEGSDIVCAAVSALSIACCNALENVAGVRPQTVEGEGLLSVHLTEEQQIHDAQIILQVFEQGIGDIAASYPQNIRVTIR